MVKVTQPLLPPGNPPREVTKSDGDFITDGALKSLDHRKERTRMRRDSIEEEFKLIETKNVTSSNRYIIMHLGT